MNPKNFKLHQQQNHLVVVRHRVCSASEVRIRREKKIPERMHNRDSMLHQDVYYIGEGCQNS